MANRILRAGHSRLILEAQLRSVVLRRMIADKNYKPRNKSSLWDKALATFHIACEAYRIEQRLLRIPRKIIRARIRMNGYSVPNISIQASEVYPPIHECPKCKVILFGNSVCSKHK